MFTNIANSNSAISDSRYIRPKEAQEVQSGAEPVRALHVGEFVGRASTRTGSRRLDGRGCSRAKQIRRPATRQKQTALCLHHFFPGWQTEVGKSLYRRIHNETGALINVDLLSQVIMTQ